MMATRSRSTARAANSSPACARGWLLLTAPITVLLAVAAGGELLFEGLFRGDATYLLSQVAGQDVVTLVVALPVLILCASLAVRGSERALLVWLGVLVYLVYTYAIYAFHVRFNPLFLVYVALLGLSLYALIGGLATADLSRIGARFGAGTPAKSTAVFLAAIAALFYLSWLGEVVPALLAGEVPRSVVDNGTPTGGVHVLDMAWILPAMALTSVWLWRGRSLGYALAGVLLSFMTVLALSIGAMMLSMWFYEQPVAPGMAAVFGAVSVASLGMLVRFLRASVQDEDSATSRARGTRSAVARKGKASGQGGERIP